VKGFTAGFPGADAPGTFLALGSDPVLDYLTDLGITAIELLPVHAFLDDRFLVEKGLTNYWGYQTSASSRPSRAICTRARSPSSSTWSRGSTPPGSR
jgi:isoamylase